MPANAEEIPMLIRSLAPKMDQLIMWIEKMNSQEKTLDQILIEISQPIVIVIA